MRLHYRTLGETGPWVIILHGLYGSSDNWMTIGRKLSAQFRVILPDQRNHGASPHSPHHNYGAMADDLFELMDHLKIETTHLVGHSMGGKTAMYFALHHPEKVDKLVVLDIAPRTYAATNNYGSNVNNHASILHTLYNIDLKHFTKRDELDKAFEPLFPDTTLRQFLLKSVTRGEDDIFEWRLNVNALRDNLHAIMEGFSEAVRQSLAFRKPTVFIRGEKSNYLLDEDTLGARRLFTNAEFVTIPDAGHWIHAEQPELLLKTLVYFLEE
jgi:pimeloyl-ACP methyl ester carboxylesterase